MSRPLDYGNAFAAALQKRLETHFKSEKREHSLCIGLFGAWGSGKTLHLKQQEQRFRATLDQPQQPESPDASCTLPVFFNAWRHETEDHLIVPLLKTTQHTLDGWLKHQESLGDKVSEGLKNAVVTFKNAALALAAGLKGKLTLPYFGELEVDAQAMLEEDAKRHEAEKPSRLDQLDTLYYDFESRLAQITGQSAAGPRLNLLFLIDDLDRCLPEKAVQMLVSIKLFLDVPGCAFVLALDDEVIERGIAHRYQDYNRDTPAHKAAPVSGHEYLEKMVQLPVHVPRPNDAEVQAYLKTHYADLFGERPPAPRLTWMETDGPDGRVRDRSIQENATRQRLRELIDRAVPKNPRKINRVAELYGFALDVAAGNGWKLEEDKQRLTLLRLVCLQLFAPDLYRFGVYEPAFLAKLEQWRGDALHALHGHLETQLQEAKTAAASNSADLRQLQRLSDPLLHHLRDAQRQRSRFDPFHLLDPDSPSDDGLHRYYRLQLDVSHTATAHATATSSSIAEAEISPSTLAARPEPEAAAERTARQPAHAERPPTPERAPARLADPALFLDRLRASDPLAWRSALEAEAERLAGRVLDDTTFQSLLSQAAQRKTGAETLAWLETLVPHLGSGQLLALYEKTQVLAQLNQELKPA